MCIIPVFSGKTVVQKWRAMTLESAFQPDKPAEVGGERGRGL